MPSFTKKTQAASDLSSLFQKSGSPPIDILDILKTEARDRAFTILHDEIPATLIRLQGYLAQEREGDETSPFSSIHRERGAFLSAELKNGPEPVVKKEPLSNGAPTPPSEGSDLPASAFEFTTQPLHLPIQTETETQTQTQTSGEWVNTTPSQATFENSISSSTTILDSPIHLSSPESKAPSQDTGAIHYGVLARNIICESALSIVERESEACLTFCKELDHWISLEVPTIEDGNAFGVDVQQSMHDKVGTLGNIALKLHGINRSHYNDRMNLAMGWCKFPGLQDHSAAIAASDRFDHYLAVNAIRTMRNKMASLLHSLQQNWEKTTNPKGEDNSARMY